MLINMTNWHARVTVKQYSYYTAYITLDLIYFEELGFYFFPLLYLKKKGYLNYPDGDVHLDKGSNVINVIVQLDK